MKFKFIIFLFSFLFVSTIVYGQTPFSDNVAQLWFNGQKQEVLDIANQRLQQNPDDIVGLILKMEYEEEYLLLDDFQQTANRVLEVGSTINTENFLEAYPLLEISINVLLEFIPNYPPDEFQEDLAKANISGKPLIYLSVIVALEEDGWVD